MDKTIAKRWVDALRSGEYEQAQFRLAREFEDGRVGYCCLGVLCEIAVKDGAIPPSVKDDRFSVMDTVPFVYGGASVTMPPVEVETWAGLPTEFEDDRYRVDVTTEIAERLVEKGYNASYGFLPELNDDLGLTFDEIADLIELTYLKD